jgi:hypothetical protein
MAAGFLEVHSVGLDYEFLGRCRKNMPVRNPQPRRDQYVTLMSSGFRVARALAILPNRYH